MIESSELKVSLILWWDAERPYRSWSCPCIVIEVKEGFFRVKSFDDFEETKWLRTGDVPGEDPLSLREMRHCTETEVRDYLREELDSLASKVAKARREFEGYTREKNRVLEQAFPK